MHKNTITQKVQTTLLALLFILAPTSVVAKVWINEFMQSNIDGIRDNLNQFPDSWVELYNDSVSPVNIQNWYISDKSSYLRGWRIAQSLPIPAKGYQLIYCDKEETGNHTHFRLESESGGAIYLFNASGILVDDVVNIPAQPAPNIARSRTEDAGDMWAYFITPTPGKKNEGQTSDILLPNPVFDQKGGVYGEAFSITLSLPADAPAELTLANIHYTTDGSEPTETSPQYQETGIYIPPPAPKDTTLVKATPVRAKIIAPGYLINRSVTNTYIVAERELNLPVISISLDPEYLWDNNFGIYVSGPSGLDNCNDRQVNWNNNWRRPVNIEYSPSADNSAAINQLAEMRISGGCSRAEPQKSLVVYANKRFGQKRFDYQLFKEKPGQEIKSFMIRNSGNDFWWTHCRDAAMQLFMGGKVDIDYQAYQPAIIFLNGEYFGIQNIRERSQEDNIFANYSGLEDIDLIENWGGVKTGDRTDFDYMMALLQNPSNIPYVMDMLDIDEYINYMILQVYVHNYDFPGNNVNLWKPKIEEGKWRAILKDIDFGCGLWNARRPDINSMEYNTNINESGGERPRRLFNALLTQDSFREEFYSRFAVYMGDLLHYNTTSHLIDSIQNMLTPEMFYHLERWMPFKWERNSRLNSWGREVDSLRSWCRQRNPHMYENLNDFFGLNGLTPMTVDISDELNEINPVVSINNIALQKPSFDGQYFLGETIRLHCNPNGDIRVGWRIEIETYNSDEVETKEIFSAEAEYAIPYNCIALNITLIKDPNEYPPDPIETAKVESDCPRFSIVENCLLISGLDGFSEILLFDMNGRLVAEIETKNPSASITLQNKGTYIVHVSDRKHNVSRKIVY